MRDGVFGNPHSVNPTSSASTALVERARAAVLRHFNARRASTSASSPPNATGALRLVGEAYPFGPRGRFLATFDNHNSVNGIREFARAKGAPHGVRAARSRPTCASTDAALERHARRGRPGRGTTCSPSRRSRTSPASSIRSSWIAPAHARGWDVLLDCAAFVPTNRLDLATWQAGLRRDLLLQDVRLPDRRRLPARARPDRSPPAATVVRGRHRRSRRPSRATRSHLRSGHAGFEDGTVDYLGIPAVEIGLRHLERIGVDTISRRVEALGTWLLEALARLRHSNGAPATRIYGPATWDRRGATVALNFLHPDGRVVDERFVDLLAAGARHLGPDRVLLQPRRRGGRVRAVEGPDDGRRAVAAR